MKKFKLLLSVVLVAGLLACTPEVAEPLSQISVNETEASTFSLRFGEDEENLTDKNTPLIVLDGKVVSKDALQSIDPNDIKSMHVLKGKRAAALYGSRGGNGVIMILLKD